MKKYRIAVNRASGHNAAVSYTPQRRILWFFWVGLSVDPVEDRMAGAVIIEGFMNNAIYFYSEFGARKFLKRYINNSPRQYIYLDEDEI